MKLASYQRAMRDSAERFAKDIGPHEHDEYLPSGHLGPLHRVTYRAHEMKIRHDDGLYRHLKFRSPDHTTLGRRSVAKLRNQAIGNYAWMKLIRRADLPQQIKVVAFILGISADADGSNASCGQERLGDEAICDERYARDSVEALELLGLIEVTRYGRTATSANVYQLTTPGGDLPAVPMRRDHQGVPLDVDGQPRTGKRAKPPALRPLLATLQGRPVPERPMPTPDRTGNPVPEPQPSAPVDNSAGTGNPVPLRLVGGTEATDEYRQPGAATGPVDDHPYRQRVASVPATGCTRTGTGLPDTNSFQLLPTNSPQATPSPTTNDQACGRDDEVVAEEDAELTAARAALDALPAGAARAWRRAAQTELENAGVPLTRRVVEIRAAELATRPAADMATA